MASRNINFTVIIPFFNDSTTIRRALDSVEQQTFLPKEVIIVDDASEPSENRKLEKMLADFSNLRLSLTVMSKNSGPSAARNEGWEKAKTEYIAFLDADDSWHPEKLAYQANILQINPEITLLGTVRNLGATLLGRDENQSSISYVSAVEQLIRNRFVTSSVVVRRTINHRFSENLRYSEDNDLWCRIILEPNEAAIIQNPLTFYHKPIRSSQGASGQYFKMIRGQYRVFLGLYQDSLLPFNLLVIAITSATLRFIRRMMLVTIDRLQGFRNLK